VQFRIPQASEGYLLLTDLRGRIVRQVAVNGNLNSVTIPVNDLAPGIYFYRIQTKDGSSGAKKLVIR
jgi:hypothetical protein